jgi:hypothetical protein
VAAAGASDGTTVGGALPVHAATANAAAKARIVREVRVGRACGDRFGDLSVMGGFRKQLTIPSDFANRVVNIHERLVYEMISKIAFSSVVMVFTLGIALCVTMVIVGASRGVKLVARIGDKLPALVVIENEEYELAA